MGMEIRIELDQERQEELKLLASLNSVDGDVSTYVRDLVEAYVDRHRADARKALADLRRAFATPEDQYVTVTAEDVVARGRTRRRV